MATLKSFEQFVSEKERAEDIQQDVVATGTPDEKGPEEAEADAKEVQANESEVSESCAICEEEPCVCEASEEVENEEEVEEGNAFGDAVRKAKEAGEEEFEFDGKTYKVEEETEVEATEEVTEETEVEETEEVTEETEVEATEEVTEEVTEEEVAEEESEEAAEEIAESCSEMLEACYEACKNEAKVWEEDAHDEHTVESYMKENAALVASLAAQSLKEMKEEYSVEAYEAACNSMIEAYTNKMNEMKESDSAHGAEEAE